MRKDDLIASLIPDIRRKYIPIMNSEVPDINVPVLKPVPAPRPAPPNFTSNMKSAVKKLCWVVGLNNLISNLSARLLKNPAESNC